MVGKQAVYQDCEVIVKVLIHPASFGSVSDRAPTKGKSTSGIGACEACFVWCSWAIVVLAHST